MNSNQSFFQVVWLKNGKELKTDNRLSTVVSGNDYQLQINDVSSDDHGIYQIDISDDEKTVTSVASLVVQGIFFFF